MNDTNVKPAGTQSIQRVAAILAALSSRSQSGARMADIAAETGLERPTVHRMLRALVAEGMARQDERSRRYFLGPFVYELGLTAAPRFRLRELAQKSLERIAAETGDTVFLAIRSGPDALCIERKEGGYPIKAFTVDVGSKIPLGVGVGGMAMLSVLPEDEAHSVMEHNSPRLSQYGDIKPAQLRRLVSEARERGYAVNLRRAPGIVAVGVAIRGPGGALAGSVSLCAIASRLPAERLDKIARLLKTEARSIEGRLAQPGAA